MFLIKNNPASLPFAPTVSCDWNALSSSVNSVLQVLPTQDPALLVGFTNPSSPMRMVSSSQLPQYLFCFHTQANIKKERKCCITYVQ